MKSTGIVRKIDELGRIVIPKELRTTLNIDDHSHLEIFVKDEYIMLKRHEPSCIFCGSLANVSDFKGKNVCRKCATEISK